MVDEIKDVQRGDLVELVLKPNAKKGIYRRIDREGMFCSDIYGKTNIPGRSYTGYAVEIRPDYICLASGWDKINDKIPDNVDGTLFYLEIIETCSKIK